METSINDRAATGDVLTIVTVTYGVRWDLLARLLSFSEIAPGICEVVVVDNGSTRPVASLVKEAGFAKPLVVRTSSNIGSAGGFKLGIEVALSRGAHWIWLLDDDNVPEALAVGIMLASAHALSEADRALVAHLAFRPQHQADIAAGIKASRCYPYHSSFFSFHIADIPFKIWRRLPWGLSINKRTVPREVAIPYAPYSGLLFHRTLLEKIGTPNADLVLYADDTEFSYRVTRSGGTIILLTDARLHELETSWNSKQGHGSTFMTWLTGHSDMRVFYSSRNQAYFDSQIWRRNAALYRLNRFIYLNVLRYFARRHKLRERYSMIRKAVTLGEQGIVGMAKDFPLS